MYAMAKVFDGWRGNAAVWQPTRANAGRRVERAAPPRRSLVMNEDALDSVLCEMFLRGATD